MIKKKKFIIIWHMPRMTTLAITQGSSFDNDIEITGVQAMFSTSMGI